jgi:two-component system NarL family sensor kinase
MDGVTIKRGAARETGSATPGMSDRWLASWLVLGMLAIGTTLLLDQEGGSLPLWVIALMFASMTLSEIFPVKVGNLRYSASDFALWLGIAVIGAWPAILLASVGVALDSVLRRVPARLGASNVALFATVSSAGAAVFAVLKDIGMAVPGEAGLPLAVLLLAYGTSGLNLALLTLGSPLMRGLGLRDVFFTHWMPVVPWFTLTAGLAAGAVYAFYTLGPGALVAAMILHGGAQVILKTIEREENQRTEVHAAFAARDLYLADALAAEARERRRIALELHDDALQNLLVAKQELAVADVDRAGERVAVAIEAMRALVTRQYQAEAGPADLRGRLEELVHLITSQRGFTFTLDVAHEPPRPVADLVASLARELVVNATKHSHGTAVAVRVAKEQDLVVLTVSDDGQGFELGSANGRLRGGHLGLTVVEDRLTAQGGDLMVGTGSPGGAIVRVRVPQAASASG